MGAPGEVSISKSICGLEGGISVGGVNVIG
jgi:hypothetical protein